MDTRKFNYRMRRNCCDADRLWPRIFGSVHFQHSRCQYPRGVSYLLWADPANVATMPVSATNGETFTLNAANGANAVTMSPVDITSSSGLTTKPM